MTSKPDTHFRDAETWQAEALTVRAILLDCGFTEDMKWGKPCYSHDGANICILQRMKNFLALFFFKGALLEDPDLLEELLEAFDEAPDLRAAFEALATGRQRGYVLYFAEAKQSETRARRIEKYREKILGGKGLHDTW